MKSYSVDGKMEKYACSDQIMDNKYGRLIIHIKEVQNYNYTLGVYTLCISRNLKFFCSGGGEGDVRVWEMRTREMVSHLKEHTHRVTNVQLIGNET
jgi:WD40 repeat protein